MPISHKHQFLKYPEYVSPLPADEVIKLGAIKQQAYDTNVEKVQKHISELDKYGFQLIKDSDKKYFSQEMDKYMKAINESSGKTDFANMANVRNILAVSRPLETDVNLLNAIKSSKEYSRRYETLSKMKPDERNAANDWLYLQDAKEWLNDGKVGSSLSSGKEYVPYNDPTKYINELLKTAKPNIKSKITMTPDGKYNIETVTEELVNNDLFNFMQDALPSHIKQQIQIDAMYQARNMSPEKKVDYYYETRGKQLSTLDNMIAQYEQYKGVLSDADRQNLATLKLKKEALTESLANFDETEAVADSAIINDLYAKFITGQSDFYAYKQVKEELTANPYALAQFQSSLRKNEDYYKEVTLAKEKQRLGLTKDGEDANTYIIGPGGIPLKLTEARKEEMGLTIEAAQKASEKFKKFTNNGTTSQTWEPLNVAALSGDERIALQNILKNGVINSTGDPNAVPEKGFDLNDVSIKQNPDKTYRFNVRFKEAGEDRIVEVWQDKFDEAFRAELKLEKPYYGDYEQSVRSRYMQPTPQSPSPFVPTAPTSYSDLFKSPETPITGKGGIDSLYNSLNSSIK